MAVSHSHLSLDRPSFVCVIVLIQAITYGPAGTYPHASMYRDKLA
jgi:hypothetical protein